MKKVIALLLAVLMMFSVANVAFATEILDDESITTTAPADTEEGADEEEILSAIKEILFDEEDMKA